MATRKAILDAAAVLLRGWVGEPGSGYVSDDGPLSDKYEALLVEAAQKAQAALASFRASRAHRMALDALLPGWRYIDANDHLPREKWNTFVSNDPDEWRAWLVENGVPKKDADEYIKRGFPRSDS